MLPFEFLEVRQRDGTVQEEQVAVEFHSVGWKNLGKISTHKNPGSWVDDLKNGGLLGCPRELVNR